VHQISREVATGLIFHLSKRNQKLFLASAWLVTRLGAALIAINNPPNLIENLYFPFAKNFLESPSIDPWLRWSESGGSPDAFPYSWPLLVFMVLAVFFDSFLPDEIWGWIIVTLLIDILITLSIKQVRETKPEHQTLPIALWIISPTPLLGLAVIGSLDYLPAIFMVLFLFAIKKQRLVVAGLLLGLAVSSKLLLAVVFFAVISFSLKSKMGTYEARKFVGACIAWTAAFSAPIFYSPAFRNSFIASPAASGPLTWGVGDQNLIIFLWPIVILAVWLITWNLRRFSYDLLLVALATPLVLTAAMPGAAPGWTIWSLPIFLPLLVRLPRRYLLLGFGSLNMSAISYASVYLVDSADLSFGPILDSAFATVTLGSAIFFIYLAWRELVVKSDFVRLHSRPALVLIAGDSGVGKDTLSEGLARSLGNKSTVQVSGDDYHLWDRGEGAWKFITHLNPQANNLPAFFDDVLKLLAGEEVRSGHYDHTIGRRLASKTSSSREFVIVSGLHALWSEEVNSQASLRVFLSMEDDLRVSLKLVRDTSQRAQSEGSIRESIAQRRSDSQKYIATQARSADLVINISQVAESKGLSDQEITFESPPKLFDNRLVGELMNTCHLDVHIKNLESDHRVIIVRGETDTANLETAFRRLEPRVSQILQTDGTWSDGPPGIIQFATLVYLSNSLRLERLV